MTQEEKQLLFKVLCEMLPHGVICHYNCVIPIEGRELHKANCKDVLKGIVPIPNGHIGFMVGIDRVNALEDDIKPYLRPMSSMTSEEREEIEVFICNEWFVEDTECATKVDREGFIEFLANYDCSGIYPEFCGEYIDWLNEHHFDYRRLIEKGLALKAPEGMYKTE